MGQTRPPTSTVSRSTFYSNVETYLVVMKYLHLYQMISRGIAVGPVTL